MLSHPEVVKIGETEYKVEGFTQFIQEKYEKYMQGYFLDLIKNNKDDIGSEYKEMLLDFFVQVEKGNYCFNSRKFIEFINIRKNFIELVWWCFSAHQPIAREEIEKWIDENEEEATLMFQRFIDGSVIDKKKVATPKVSVN